VTQATRYLSTLWVLIAVEQVRDMDCPRFEHGVTANPIDVEYLASTNGRYFERSEVGVNYRNVAIAEINRRIQCLAYPRCRLDEGIEHRP
jgi:hypothetical protein